MSGRDLKGGILRRGSVRRYACSALLVAVIIVGILNIKPVKAGTFTEWTIPTANSIPVGIFISNGLVFFTEDNVNKIGSLDPATGIFAEWTVPTAGSQPYGIFVSGNSVFFTESSVNKIGSLSDIGSGTTTHISLTSSSASTASVVSTASGNNFLTTSVTSVTGSTISKTTFTSSGTTSVPDLHFAPLMGSISGQNFNDLNGNGVKDNGDLGLSGWTITIQNKTNTFNNTVVNLSVLTDGSGFYNVTGLFAAIYLVNVTLQAGWIEIFPGVSTLGNKGYVVNLAQGDNVVNKDFGNLQVGTISMTKTETSTATTTATTTDTSYVPTTTTATVTVTSATKTLTATTKTFTVTAMSITKTFTVLSMSITKTFTVTTMTWTLTVVTRPTTIITITQTVTRPPVTKTVTTTVNHNAAFQDTMISISTTPSISDLLGMVMAFAVVISIITPLKVQGRNSE